MICTHFDQKDPQRVLILCCYFIPIFTHACINHTELTRYNECVETLTILCESDPGHLLGRAQLGTCHMRLKDYQRAGEAFTSVLQTEPDHKMALQNYGN